VGRGERERDKVALPACQFYLGVFPEQRVERESVLDVRCGPITCSGLIENRYSSLFRQPTRVSLERYAAMVSQRLLISIMSTWSPFNADSEVSVMTTRRVSGGVATMRGTGIGCGVDRVDGGLLLTLLVYLSSSYSLSTPRIRRLISLITFELSHYQLSE
jgi:hypothetical protein